MRTTVLPFVLIFLIVSCSIFDVIKAGLGEPCSDMTKIAPNCKYGLIKNFDSTIKTLGEGSSFVDVISDNNEKHYMLIKVPLPSLNSSRVMIQGNVRSGETFNSFLESNIKDDCGGAQLEGESMTFLNSKADILLTGYFVAQYPVCIGRFQVTSQTFSSFKNIPFMATLSSAGVVQSVTPFSNLIGYSIQAMYIDNVSGKRYFIMQKGYQIYLIIYKDQVILRKAIAGCEDTTKCKVMPIHYSVVYDRVVVSFFDTQEFQLIIDGENKEYLPHQSALWVLLLNPKDGSYVHSQKVFHSSSAMIPTPKIKFDSLGKLNILLSCEADCFLNGNAISPNIFLLQYDYIKTTFTFTKNFIQISQFKQDYFKIHSLSIERDNTIATVITGTSADPYSIVDGNGRTMQAQSKSVYQFRFRHLEGKIIQVQQLSTEYDITDSFIVSTSSPIVNSNNYVGEQKPIIYIRLSGTSKELKALSFSSNGYYLGTEYQYVTSSASYGGKTSSPQSTSKFIKGMKIKHSSDYVYGIEFRFRDGTSQSIGSSDNRETEFTLADDEYITKIHHEYRDYGFWIWASTTLACIRFDTNKNSYGANGCWGGNIEYVPSGLDLVGASMSCGAVVDSIWYHYGYWPTYSCASGYTGASCNTPVCYDLEATNPNVCNGKGKCTGPNTCSCSASISPSDSGTCVPYGFCEDLSSYNSGSCHGRGTCFFNNTCACDRSYYGDACEIEATCFGISKSSYGVCSNHGKCTDIDLCECSTGYAGKNCELPICFGKVANHNGKFFTSRLFSKRSL